MLIVGLMLVLQAERWSEVREMSRIEDSSIGRFLKHDIRWSILYSKAYEQIKQEKNCFVRQKMRAVLDEGATPYIFKDTMIEQEELMMVEHAIMEKIEALHASNVKSNATTPVRRSPRFPKPPTRVSLRINRLPGEYIMPYRGGRLPGCLLCNFDSTGCYTCLNNDVKLTYQERALKAGTVIACSKCAWHKGCKRCWNMMVAEYHANGCFPVTMKNE